MGLPIYMLWDNHFRNPHLVFKERGKHNDYNIFKVKFDRKKSNSMFNVIVEVNTNYGFSIVKLLSLLYSCLICVSGN